MLKTDVTWGKIASLYCVAGGLAIDCVQQGHPEYLYGIVETMGFVIERDAATWIAQQGGWVRTKCIVILYCYCQKSDWHKVTIIMFSTRD